MKKESYHSSIMAGIGAHEAFDRISQVNEWWAASFKGQAKALNDRFSVQFGDTWVKFVIAEVVPGKKIVWEVTDCYLHWLHDKTEWKGTRIVWELSGDDKSTRVDMTHEGLFPDVECYDTCKAGWDHFIKTSLFKLLTEGKGQLEKSTAVAAEN